MTTDEPRYPYVHAFPQPPEAELCAALLFELGATGVEERDASTMSKSDGPGGLLLAASFADEEQAREALRALPERFAARLAFVVGDQWRDGWRAYFKPSRIGKRLWVCPSWEDCPAAQGEGTLTVDPGHAFGTGTHETTRLLMREIEDRLEPDVEVLDVGCGSGILGIACLLLGARHVDALDVDSDAVQATLENARVNRVADALAASTRELTSLQGRYPLVLANIETKVLVPLAPQLMHKVAPGGQLMLSGVLRSQASQVLRAYSGFACVGRPSDGDWVALILEAPRVSHA